MSSRKTPVFLVVNRLINLIEDTPPKIRNMVRRGMEIK